MVMGRLAIFFCINRCGKKVAFYNILQERTNYCEHKTLLNSLFRDVCNEYEAIEQTLFCMLSFSRIENDSRSHLQACSNLFYG